MALQIEIFSSKESKGRISNVKSVGRGDVFLVVLLVLLATSRSDSGQYGRPHRSISSWVQWTPHCFDFMVAILERLLCGALCLQTANPPLQLLH